MRLDENTWKLFWCNSSSQGINYTKSLVHVLWKKGLYIRSCYVTKENSHIKRYQDLQQYKKACKGVNNEYSENIKGSISSLQNK